MKSKEELFKILNDANEMGVLKVEVDGVTYTLPGLKTKYQPPVPEDLKAQDIVNPMSILDEMSEDEIKYWSSPYYDVLIADKERQQQMSAEEKLNE